MIRAGALRTRVTIQHPFQTTDAYGYPINTWATLATVQAEIKQVTGRESWASDRTANISSMAVKIRHRADIQPNYRVLFDDRELRIVGHPIDPDNRKRVLILTCEEVTI